MTEKEYRTKLEIVLESTIVPNAIRVDAEGVYPAENVKALAEAGLLGLISSPDVGGMGQGPGAAVEVVEHIGRACSSTAMIVCMHYSAAAVIEVHGTEAERRKTASGEHVTTLAFSETGSRSHFWAPVGTASRTAGGVQLDAAKSWITSANHAATYVWSSQPLEAEGASTIWLVPRSTPGIEPASGFNGLGLRGNDSAPCKAVGAVIPEENRLGADGDGFNVMMGIVLPWFNLMNAACSVGIAEAAVQRSIAHVSGIRYAHLDSSLADLPTIRAYVARMRIKTDAARALLHDAVNAVETGREDTMLRVLEVKAACNETAAEVCDTGMRVCGGAAFRKDVGVDRAFRDARAGLVMAPTSDVLYDFIGKAVCGMDLF